MSDHKHLYIRDGNTFTTLAHLMSRGFSQSSWGYFATTFLNANCTEQEDKQRRRSFDDLLVIARTYFPETTEEELAKVLTTTKGLRALFCNDIKKIVFVKDYGNSSFTINSGYGLEIKGASNYSGEDIYRLAGLEHND